MFFEGVINPVQSWLGLGEWLYIKGGMLSTFVSESLEFGIRVAGLLTIVIHFVNHWQITSVS